jgi:hypothetical protein
MQLAHRLQPSAIGMRDGPPAIKGVPSDAGDAAAGLWGTTPKPKLAGLLRNDVHAVIVREAVGA